MIYTVEANQRIYTVVDDLTTVFQVIAGGRVTGVPNDVTLRQFHVHVDHPDVFVKTSPDGFFCLAGIIDRIFPDLDSTDYLLTLQIDATNYQTQTVPVNVLMNSTFPLTQLAIAMAYTPLRLEGRVTLDADGSPVAGATVRVTQPAQTLALRTPLHFDHAAGTMINSCTLAPAAPRALVAGVTPPDDRLTLDDASGLIAGNILQIGSPAAEYVAVSGTGAAPGEVLLQAPVQSTHIAGAFVQRVHRLTREAARLSSELALHDATGLAPGAILQLGEPELAEHMVVDAAGANPGELALRGALRRSYLRGAIVRHVAAATGGASVTTAGEATAGEGLLQLGAAIPSASTAVEIADAAAARNEYHLLNGLSDGEGYYRLDGISRLDELTLLAAAGSNTQERSWTVDPRQPVTVVNFRLSPP